MKVKRKIRIKHLLVLCLMMAFCNTGFTKNFQYEGMDIIVDRPEGELKYFDATIEYFYYGEEKRVVPMVFTQDGKVFIYNLTGYTDPSCVPVWTEGRIENEDLIFEKGEICRFNYMTAFQPTIGYAVNTIDWGKANYEENKQEQTNKTDPMVFHKNESGSYTFFEQGEYGLIWESRNLVIKCELKESDSFYITPPEGYEEEDYQVNFMQYGALFYPIPNNQKQSSLRLKVVRTPDEIYIKGLSRLYSGNPEAWIKGEIKGDKVVFKNGQCFGVGRNSRPMYLTPMTFNLEYDDMYWSNTRGSGSFYILSLESTGEDITFSYDPASGKLDSPTSDLAFTSHINESWSKVASTENLYGYYDVYYDYLYKPEFIKIPENYEFEPISPIKNNYVSYLDKNGYMMEPSNMYLQYMKNGEPVQREYVDLNTWTYIWGEFQPYENFYVKMLTCVDGLGFNLGNNQLYISSEANLVYTENKESTGIKKVEIFPKDESDSENMKKFPVYDLMGRKVAPDRMSSGIYIINGKKVMIK